MAPCWCRQRYYHVKQRNADTAIRSYTTIEGPTCLRHQLCRIDFVKRHAFALEWSYDPVLTHR